MPVITLISDRRPEDFFLGRLKGKILSACTDVHIIDLAHNIRHHSILKAAFIIKNSYKDFPKGTVHLIGIDGECTETKKHIIIEAEGQYFITSDNGIISLIFENENIDKIIKIELCKESEKVIPALFSFAEKATKIINGEKPESFGIETGEIKRFLPIKPILQDNSITGELVYSDSYGNAVSNITFDMFKKVAKGRKYKIYAGSESYCIKKISARYQDVEEGDLTAVFNSLGLLEIAMNRGNLVNMFNLEENTKIRIEFYD